MKERQINAIRKIAKLTGAKCATCPVTEVHRCCDKMFCSIIKKNHKEIGVVYPWDTSKSIPFMGDNGCIVSPEHRPFCSGFVCGQHLNDRKFRREYFRLCEKAEIPPQTNANLTKWTKK